MSQYWGPFTAAEIPCNYVHVIDTTVCCLSKS